MDTNNQAMISVLMPAYNAEKYIKQAIESILNQTYYNLELLIADDKSTDKTLKIIESFNDNRIKTFHNNKNIGYLETWNKLIEACKGDFITFQDADDYSSSDRIKILVNELMYNKLIDVCGSNYIWIDSKGTILKESDFSLTHADILNHMPSSFQFIGSAIMIRRSVYEDIGGYHPFFNRMGGEDHYWFYKICEKHQVANIKQSLYYYRFNTKSVTGNIANNLNKLFAQNIIEHLINQRKNNITDDLDGNNIKALNILLKELKEPFTTDKSFFYQYIAKRRFYEGHKNLAISYALHAIRFHPYKFSLYRDLFYYLRN